jgi:hypothetical protein
MNFFTLLLATFLVAAILSHLVVVVFAKPLQKVFDRIIGDEISHAWVRYVKFAIYVVGISGGVRIWQLDRYLMPEGEDAVVLTNTLWGWEVFRTVLGTVQSITWMLLVVFLVALVAYVIVRGMELRRSTT